MPQMFQQIMQQLTQGQGGSRDAFDFTIDANGGNGGKPGDANFVMCDGSVRTDDGLLLPAVQDDGLLLPAVLDDGLLLPAVQDNGLLLPY